MIVVYGVSLIVGGVLIATSILLGGHDADADADVDAGGDFDAHADVDIDADADVDASADIDAGADADVDGGADTQAHAEVADAATAWIPFLSMRFWTFFLCFFGMTGIILTLPQLLNNWVGILLLSLVTGLACGLGASYTIHALKGKDVGSIAHASDFEGASAKVLLPISSETKGKIRTVVHGDISDLIAWTEDEQPIDRGDQVLIVRYEQGTAKVTKITSAKS